MSRGKWPPLRPETSEWERFSLALDEHPTPCRRGTAWTSEAAAERAAAVEACGHCPILSTCHEAAQSTGEPFGVWAGVDRSTKTQTAKERRRSA